MPETDHPLKRFVALAAPDVAAWLLERPVRHVTTRQGELTAPPEALDSDLILFVTLDDGQEVILHLEFQGPGSKKPMPLRMLDYQVRLALTYRDRPTVSVVWYLGGAGARDDGAHQRVDQAGQVYLAWHYRVIRLWQLDAEALLALQRPALLALIGQTRIRDSERTLTTAVRQLVQGTQGELQERLLAELLLLCSDEELAAMAEQLIARDYGLPETPMMRKLREEGREEGQLALVLHLLTRRCGPLSADVTTQISHLAPNQLLDLADALLDFAHSEDLVQWLARTPGEAQG